jgi:hypothetical protein
MFAWIMSVGLICVGCGIIKDVYGFQSALASLCIAWGVIGYIKLA